jgi:hypothetical protein
MSRPFYIFLSLLSKWKSAKRWHQSLIEVLWNPRYFNLGTLMYFISKLKVAANEKRGIATIVHRCTRCAESAFRLASDACIKLAALCWFCIIFSDIRAHFLLYFYILSLCCSRIIRYRKFYCLSRCCCTEKYNVDLSALQVRCSLLYHIEFYIALSPVYDHSLGHSHRFT